MINKLIGKLDNRNVDNFTSNFGLWIRRTFKIIYIAIINW